MRSLASDVVDSSHQSESYTVQLGAGNAAFVNCTGCSVGSGSWKPDAEGPACHINFNSAFFLISTLFEFILTPLGVHTFFVLVGAPLSNAGLHIFEGVSLDAGQDEKNKNDYLHEN